MSTEKQTEKQNIVQLTWYGRAGEWAKKNQGDIVLVVGFILVAVISFGVGILSAPGLTKNPLIIENQEASISEMINSDQGSETGNTVEDQNTTQTSLTSDKGILVASKNGTKYYWPWSSWAKRIKPENLIWFKSEADAQKAGFSKSADFDEIAPAGYKTQ
ncbi:MAG: hypothetical protein A2174_02605 [Candidatus Portnoybacteria bacterium RBG_13_41_18]|uniref:Uncharacterized protein n=1 Tax=Candidatus Portnoybacteria bacterium RBG_13_41_18 TaxID=1801991 RepID=A0A1G2FA54_9BACT|nr:MAG: hypothetical protein A2174_02605 [Candidatus Portnoybacteria bacterium RBG_13_41_18]